MSFSDATYMTELHDEPKLSQQLLPQEIQEFNYSVLTPEVRTLVQSKTSELKSLMRRSAQNIIDIGQKLLEVKEQLGHGNFRVWLKAEFDWSVRTASRFMQVATQFKCVNLAHLNIAVSALYLLAEPSTPEKARKQALKIAQGGDNITYTKAKAIVKRYQELAQPNALKSATTYISAQAVETVSTKESDKRLEQKAVEKIDLVPTEDLEVAIELQPELSNHVRILNIEYQNLELVTNIAEAFELTFAGVRVDFEGNPETLIILFEQMQNNPAFTEEVLQQAKLLARIELVQQGVNKQKNGILER